MQTEVVTIDPAIDAEIKIRAPQFYVFEADSCGRGGVGRAG